ncbi:MAG: FAD-dependent oxidoreductase [Steroidobacteraceae bacterium]
MNLRSDSAFWSLKNGIGPASPRLSRDLRCEVAIVGAGVSGALIADELVREGLTDIVIVDKRGAALGSTAASTALLQYEIDAHLVDLHAILGPHNAMLAYLACIESVDLLEQLVPGLPTDVEFARRPSLYLASSSRDVARLEAEYGARRALGIDLKLLSQADLRGRYSINRPAALLSSRAAEVDPVLLARALLRRAQQGGAQLFGRVEVQSIEEDAHEVQLRTSDGNTIQARAAIVCGGHESMRFLPARLARLRTSYALVTEPAAFGETLATRPLVWETARPYLYARTTRDNRTMLGGEDTAFRKSPVRDSLLKKKARRLSRMGTELLGPLPPVDYAWAGVYAETPDSLPYIGIQRDWRRRVHFALCYGANGMVFAVQAANMLSASLQGRSHPLEEVFGFARLKSRSRLRARTAGLRSRISAWSAR